jgi:hypothetical protein
MSALISNVDIEADKRDVGFVPILLQKRFEGFCEQ